MEQKKETPFVGYEYKEITVPNDQVSLYMDCYENFGWEPDERIITTAGKYHMTTIRMKRDRKIINKMELTRLQRNFEACAREIDALERSKTTVAVIWAFVVGLIGTAFIAGSVFAVTNRPPQYVLCILLSIPGFIGWIAPYFVYRHRVGTQSKKVQPMIEAKNEEIYAVCEKGHSLL